MDENNWNTNIIEKFDRPRKSQKTNGRRSRKTKERTGRSCKTEERIESRENKERTGAIERTRWSSKKASDTTTERTETKGDQHNQEQEVAYASKLEKELKERTEEIKRLEKVDGEGGIHKAQELLNLKKETMRQHQKRLKTCQKRIKYLKRKGIKL